MTEFERGQLSGLRIALDVAKHFERDFLTVSWRDQFSDLIRGEMLKIGEEPTISQNPCQEIEVDLKTVYPKCSCDYTSGDTEDMELECACCHALPGELCKHVWRNH